MKWRSLHRLTWQLIVASRNVSFWTLSWFRNILVEFLDFRKIRLYKRMGKCTFSGIFKHFRRFWLKKWVASLVASHIVVSWKDPFWSEYFYSYKRGSPLAGSEICDLVWEWFFAKFLTLIWPLIMRKLTITVSITVSSNSIAVSSLCTFPCYTFNDFICFCLAGWSDE